MKMKKLLALLLAAVMAVCMLTACGGGDVKIGDINDLLQQQGIEAKVSSSVELDMVVSAVAREMKKNNVYRFDTEAFATGMEPMMSKLGFDSWRVYNGQPGTERSLEEAAVISVRDYVQEFGSDGKIAVSGAEMTDKAGGVYWVVVVAGR